MSLKRPKCSYSGKSKLEAIIALLEAIPKHKKINVTSLAQDAHMDKGRVRDLLIDLSKRGFLEPLGPIAGHEGNYYLRIDNIRLSYDGASWLQRIKQLAVQVGE